MDYTEIYLQRRPTEQAVAPAAGNASTLALHRTLNERVDQVVGGTLSAQEYRDQLDTLAGRVDVFEEKMYNMTRLLKLSQGLQDEREAELRQQNEELRTRLQRQETHTAQLQRELVSLREAMAAAIQHAVTEAEGRLAQQYRAAAEEQRATAVALETKLDAQQHQQEERSHAVEAEVAELSRTVANDAASAAELETTVQEHTKRLEALSTELESGKQRARRAAQRQKEQLDELTAGLQELCQAHGELLARVDQVDCAAASEYQKVRVLLQQKCDEANALAAVLEKELLHVNHVAQQHDILRAAETPSLLERLKFCPPNTA